MGTIEQTLKEIAEVQFEGFSYVFENWEDADTKLEKIEYPAIVSILPSGGLIQFKNGKAYDTEYIALAFLDKAPRGAEGEDNADIYTRMKAEGSRFIKTLNDTRLFTPLTSVQYQTICERMATIVTGVMFQITLEQQIGGCI